MAARRPIVNDAGVLKELPAGDTLVGVGVVPFYVSAGTGSSIPLTTSNAIPFVKTDGSTHSDIPLTVI